MLHTILYAYGASAFCLFVYFWIVCSIIYVRRIHKLHTTAFKLVRPWFAVFNNTKYLALLKIKPELKRYYKKCIRISLFTSILVGILWPIFWGLGKTIGYLYDEFQEFYLFTFKQKILRICKIYIWNKFLYKIIVRIFLSKEERAQIALGTQDGSTEDNGPR